MANFSTQLTLLSNASATGSAVAWPGGAGIVTGEATFGGGTIKLQMQTINGTWVDVPSASLTAAGAVAFNLPRCLIRMNVATATAVYAYALGTAEP